MEKYFCLVFIILLNHTKAQEGCEFFCDCADVESVTCTGVDFFPSFATRAIIESITIVSSNLNELRISRNEFLSLELVTIINSRNIPCEDIFNIRNEGVEVIIDFNCEVIFTTQTSALDHGTTSYHITFSTFVDTVTAPASVSTTSPPSTTSAEFLQPTPRFPSNENTEGMNANQNTPRDDTISEDDITDNNDNEVSGMELTTSFVIIESTSLS